MGDVHLCVDVNQRRLLVVKWLRAELHEGSQAAIRFRREAELMTKANFPGVIKVEEWGVDEFGRTWMAMEFVDGLIPSAVVGPGDCWSVHRLLDGVGRSLDDLHGRPATDRYAVAIIAFELLAGRRPYEGRTIPELLRQHLESPVPELQIPRRLRAGVMSDKSGKTTSIHATPNLDLWMRKAMAKEPRLRYGSAAEMASEFERAARTDGLFEPADPADLAPLFPPASHPIAEVILDGEPRQRFDLRHGPLVLGRHEACQVVLNSARLSRLHACVYLHRGRIWAADLHSQNGTMFQGRALAPGVPMPFAAGGQTSVFTLYNRNVAVRLCPADTALRA